jgi:large subunit ribosomal protein L30
MADVKLTQVRSPIHSSGAQRDTLRSLKLGKIGSTSTHKDSPQLQGMIRRVSHLVKVGDE